MGSIVRPRRYRAVETTEDIDEGRSHRSFLQRVVSLNRISVLSLINLVLFWVLLYELILKGTLSQLSEELWMNAVVRPPVIILLLLWGWAVGLATCRAYGLDVERCLGVAHSEARFVTALDEHHVLTTALLATAAFQLNFLSHLHSPYPLPRSLIFIMLGVICTNPLTLLSETRRFTVARCLWTIINPFGPVTFREVLLADVLTSLSKTLVDVQVITCVFGFSTISYSSPLLLKATVFSECFHSHIAPVMMALPFLFRLRQCITRFVETKEWANIWNAIKYTSSLPVIGLAFLKSERPEEPWLVTAFIAAAAINSTYGFVWDCVFDWGLWQARKSPMQGATELSHPPLLRSPLFFPTPAYYSVMCFDIFLRFAWLMGFWSGFQWLGSECGLFVYEALEISRRCVWIVYRIEWEHLVLGQRMGGMRSQEAILHTVDADSDVAPLE